MVGDRPPVIMIAVGRNRPAIVGPGLDPVQLIAVARTHFVAPQPPLAIKHQTQRIAVAQRPDLRAYPARRRKGIVRGNRAVQPHPNDLAQIAGHILGRVQLLPVAGRNEQMAAIRGQGQPVAEMAPPADHRALPPDDCQLTQPGDRAKPQRCRGHHRAQPAVTRVGPRQCHRIFAGRAGAPQADDVAQPALTTHRRRWHPRDRHRRRAGPPQHQLAGFFRNQRRIAARQQGHGPWRGKLGNLGHRKGGLSQRGGWMRAGAVDARIADRCVHRIADRWAALAPGEHCPANQGRCQLGRHSPGHRRSFRPDACVQITAASRAANRSDTRCQFTTCHHAFK